MILKIFWQNLTWNFTIFFYDSASFRFVFLKHIFALFCSKIVDEIHCGFLVDGHQHFNISQHIRLKWSKKRAYSKTIFLPLMLFTIIEYCRQLSMHYSVIWCYQYSTVTKSLYANSIINFFNTFFEFNA